MDKNTFGRAPAAMYLTTYLTEKGDQALVRKVSRVIRETRELLNDVVASHLLTDEMKRASFSKLLHLIRDSIGPRCDLLPDRHAGDLVKNILIGEIRTFEKRSAKARSLETLVQRGTPDGKSVPIVKATPFPGELKQEERIAALQEKSRNYLARKGKRNTLY